KKKITDWGQLRFSVIGGLLSRPPEKGQLGATIRTLAGRSYRHPHKDEWVKFGASTIERWYYQALRSTDPVAALSRRVRSDSGITRTLNSRMISALAEQYARYPHWSYQLHADNLTALVEEQPELGAAPSYSTVRRRMKARGWSKKRRPKTPGQHKAAERLEHREVRSYESPYVHSLWHLDFHAGSRRIVDEAGGYHTPKALCVLDDSSRLCCHIQWYLDETADSLIHGLTQAFHKRGLPRSLMTDNGSAMIAGETKSGLGLLGIEHETTLPYSPYQNGKQESFWGQLEGRMVAMLTGVEPLTLEFLNRATQAWVEMEYNRTRHEEINCTPLDRLLAGPDVSRPCPEHRKITFSFTACESRAQRQSDGTIQLKGVRFEIPSRFRHITRLTVRYRSWDLSHAYLVAPQTNSLLAEVYPQDKTQNSNGVRRSRSPLSA
ncbi:DDE-type integrase/transposase/recombinase, partial [Desulfogranum mediterraneum]|uniref:DDE-type integrase/transposase/recombinase n=1 Tax=Desulfogranum mediterraneum TaxID=160661 RepID=UPI0012946951